MRQGLADTLQLLGTIQTFAVSNSSRSRASVPLDWLNCSALLDSIQTRTYSSAGSRAPPQLHVCSPPTRARQLISTLRHPREVRQVQYGMYHHAMQGICGECEKSEKAIDGACVHDPPINDDRCSGNHMYTYKVPQGENMTLHW